MTASKGKARVRLQNSRCIYCNVPFDAQNRPEVEHVIGRKFVPKGSLAAQWNLIANACGGCNDEKCDLENDLSAILMRPDPWARCEADPRIIEEARRKETARSKRTGKAVRDSGEELTIKGNLMPGIDISATMVTGPQFDPARAERLAFFHVSAFFYLTTYKQGDSTGSAIPGGFYPVVCARRPDWGNPHLMGFQQLTASWVGRVYAIGADTFFKIVIRRSVPFEPPLWSWALEWNHSLRLAGFFGDGDAALTAYNQLPPLKNALVETGVDPSKGRFVTRARQEIPLAEGDDHMFDCPADFGSGCDSD